MTTDCETRCKMIENCLMVDCIYNKDKLCQNIDQHGIDNQCFAYEEAFRSASAPLRSPPAGVAKEG